MDGLSAPRRGRPGGAAACALAALALVGTLAAAAAEPPTAAPPPAATPGADAAAVVTRIAVGSCARQDRPQPIWSAILGFEPDVMLLLGDNVYGKTEGPDAAPTIVRRDGDTQDGRSEDMEVLQRQYRTLGDQPGFAALRAAVPVVAVWNDHDYGTDVGGRDYRYRDESQLIFCDFFGIPADDPVRTQAGIYRSVVWGPPGRRVQLICLDTRYHRSPLETLPPAARKPGQGPYRPSTGFDATVLGAAQWRWLARTLREPADVRIILSSIQVASIEHHWKHWGNFPDERARLLRTIRDSGATGVLVVSGDRLAAEISRIPPGSAALAYPLYDLTASSLNQPQRMEPDREPNRHRLGRRFHGANFGTIGIDWGGDGDSPAAAGGHLTLAIRDERGDVVVERRVPLADLAPPVAPVPR